MQRGPYTYTSDQAPDARQPWSCSIENTKFHETTNQVSRERLKARGWKKSGLRTWIKIWAEQRASRNCRTSRLRVWILRHLGRCHQAPRLPRKATWVTPASAMPATSMSANATPGKVGATPGDKVRHRRWLIAVLHVPPATESERECHEAPPPMSPNATLATQR